MTEMQKISPFLWFDGQAEEAARFYTSIFPDSKMGAIARYPEGSPGTPGSVMIVSFELFGQAFTALNGGPHVTFNEAVSFVVSCDTQEEIDRYWSALGEGGKEVQCGWLQDRYGLSWQVCPTRLMAEYSAGDPERAQRVFTAMMTMVKFDIAALERAAAEE